jgi:1,4-dihydroxy-2-naphthoate polyprenyltransferase
MSGLPPSGASALPVPKSQMGVWVLASRPKTLWAAVAPVLLGTALAAEAGGFHAFSALCALLGAVLIQIGTNFSNDYADFVQGADTKARKGPLRVTQAGLVAPGAVKRAAIIVFGLAVVAGLYLIVRGGWPVLAIGIVSIICGILYTTGPYSLAYLGLGDVFVLIFFGPVAVGGTYYVQALALEPFVLIAGLGPGLLAVAILLANNIRDVEEDRIANKKTLVVRFGRRFGVGLYAFCLVAAALLPLLLLRWAPGHPWSVLSVVVLPLGVPLARKLAKERDARDLNPVLGSTARLLLLYCILFSVGWLL